MTHGVLVPMRDLPMAPKLSCRRTQRLTKERRPRPTRRRSRPVYAVSVYVCKRVRLQVTCLSQCAHVLYIASTCQPVGPAKAAEVKEAEADEKKNRAQQANVCNHCVRLHACITCCFHTSTHWPRRGRRREGGRGRREEEEEDAAGRCVPLMVHACV